MRLINPTLQRDRNHAVKVVLINDVYCQKIEREMVKEVADEGLKFRSSPLRKATTETLERLLGPEHYWRLLAPTGDLVALERATREQLVVVN